MPRAYPVADAQGLAIPKRAIAFRSVAGAGNAMPAPALFRKRQLVAGGLADADVVVTPTGAPAMLAARYRGTDAAPKPLVLSGRIDMVDAGAADRQRDPSTPVMGSGAIDTKFGVSKSIAALFQVKREEFRPARDALPVLSGDEETGMMTSRALAATLSPGAVVPNSDGGGGRLGEDGRPRCFSLEGAETAHADFVLEATDADGHSGQPHRGTPVCRIAHALDRIGAYRFTPQGSDLTRACFRAAADPRDEGAIRRVSADPAYVGGVDTTCVAVMTGGGHARNALPHRATANIDCRAFPGTAFATVQAIPARVANDPPATPRYDDEASVTSDASPMRGDVTGAARRALDAADRAGIPIVPTMAAGASDSMYFRDRGLPGDGVGPRSIRASDDFSHGLNEPTSIADAAFPIAFRRATMLRLAR